MRSSGLLRSEFWKFLPDVSGQPIGPIFKGQESGTSVRNYHYSLRNNPEKCRAGVNNYFRGNFPKRNFVSDIGGGLGGTNILHCKVFIKAYAMTTVVIREPLTTETGIDTWPAHVCSVRSVLEEAALVQTSLGAREFLPVSIMPRILLFHLLLNTARVRRKIGRSLLTVKQNKAISDVVVIE